MTWRIAATLAEVQLAKLCEAEADGLALLLYDMGGAICATGAVCPHHAAWLIDGHVEGTIIHCPRHMGSFDIKTGAQKSGPPSEPLQIYNVRVEDGQVYVDVPSPNG